ncbi:MAG: RNA polymerase sigma factor [Phycisphaerae bacterium]
MLRFQDGDDSAFEELVRKNTDKVHALIYRFLGRPGQVEDLTQEVFLRIYKTRDRYKPTAKFSTWLYRIAANLSFNVLRSRARKHPVTLEMASPDDDDSYYRDVEDEQIETPYNRMDENELSEKIAQAIDHLPENQRVAIVLNKYENKSYEEISKILQCSTMAVKSLLSRARANLRTSLRKYVEP